MSKRDIGQEILTGLDELAAWKRGELKLKTTKVRQPSSPRTGSLALSSGRRRLTRRKLGAA
jgi:hypothetical protein